MVGHASRAYEGARAAVLAGWGVLSVALLDHLLTGYFPAGRATLAVLSSAGMVGAALLLPLALVAGLLGRPLSRPWIFRLEAGLVIALWCTAAWSLALYLRDPRLPISGARPQWYAAGILPGLLVGGLVSRRWRARPPRVVAVLGLRASLVVLSLGMLWWIARATLLYLQEGIALVLVGALLGLAWALRERLRRVWAWGGALLLLGGLGTAWLAYSPVQRDLAARDSRMSRVALRRGVLLLRPLGASLPALATQAPPADLPREELTFSRPAISARPAKHVILVTVDALRADLGGHLPRGGFAQLSREALHFSTAYSTAPGTIEALGALFFGRYYAEGTAPPSLVRVFRDAGWHTIAVLPGTYISAKGHPWINNDFAAVVSRHRYPLPQGPIAQPMTEAVLAQMDAAPPGASLFAWVHYNDPHHPYDGAGEDDPDRYRSEVARIDLALGRLLQGLAARGMLDDALVIVSADHGEEFGEHGGATHGLTLFDESLRVPLWIRLPGRQAPQTIATPVSLLGLAGLIAEVTGVSLPAGFAPFAWEPRPFFAFRRAARDLRYGDFMVRQGPYKLIYNADTESAQLIDLAQDPREQENLLDALPGVAAALAGQLLAEVDRGAR